MGDADTEEEAVMRDFLRSSLSVTNGVRVPASPHLPISPSPCPHVPASPYPRVPASPYPRIPASDY
ncbi:MAG: hypothetical protein RMY29_018440 [Nostoc sp. CreGUA01]|nr:hypothetical protein [Nostoc sp. CreGUA01]